MKNDLRIPEFQISNYLEKEDERPNLFGPKAKTKEEVGEIFKNQAPINANTAAKIILKNIKKKNKRILVGGDARWYDRIQRFFPNKFKPYQIGFVSNNNKKINLLNKIKW